VRRADSRQPAGKGAHRVSWIVPENGRRLGCTKQAVHQLLGFRGPAPRPRKPVACPACGGAAGTAPTARDYAPALCLACLEKRPGAMFAQRLRALRIAAGLSCWALAGRAGLSAWAVRVLEQGKRRPLPGTLRKLAKALGAEPGELLPGEKGK
jgi:hypothetical protein